jgi:hypothetical protein
MIKTFPKNRVCVIDVYPLFEEGLKKAISFSRSHNISLSTAEGRRLLLSYCVKHIEKTYTESKTEFPKTLALNTRQINPKFKHFIEEHFDKMMNCLPAPYCGKIDFSSPDLEFVAEKSLKSFKSKRRYIKYLNDLKIR